VQVGRIDGIKGGATESHGLTGKYQENLGRTVGNIWENGGLTWIHGGSTRINRGLTWKKCGSTNYVHIDLHHS